MTLYKEITAVIRLKLHFKVPVNMLAWLNVVKAGINSTWRHS